MNLTIQDLEKIQELLQEASLDYQMELQDGNIVIMRPSDIVSSEIFYHSRIISGLGVARRRTMASRIRVRLFPYNIHH